MTEFIINSSNNEKNRAKEKLIAKDNNNLLEKKTNNQEAYLNKDMQNSENIFNENNYNPEPFISLSVNKNKNSILSKSDKIILEYNQIKTNFNKLKPKNFKTQEKYLKKLSEYNITLLNYLGELSTLLNKIIDNPKLFSSKKNYGMEQDSCPLHPSYLLGSGSWFVLSLWNRKTKYISKTFRCV